jgi:hypothetical protein
MAGWEDVRRIARALPGTSERASRGLLQWRVRDRLFAWERPLRRADVDALGDRVREAPVLGVRVEDLGVKEALLEDDPSVFFTTPHFDGYPAVLVWLDRVGPEALEEVVVAAWVARAPRGLARAYLDEST